jgi:hypothetical protein
MALYKDDELLEYLKSVNWDTTLTSAELLQILKGDVEKLKGFTRQNLFTKLLNFYTWHKVRHMVEEEELPEVLAEEVIQGLFPRDLRDKYRYVKSLL